MSISLTSSINSCKAKSGSSEFYDTQRIQNPYDAVCFNWNGVDLTGRQVAPTSFMTRTAGCNSALDSIVTENALRPSYIEFMNSNTSAMRNGDLYSVISRNGDFGIGLRSEITNNCGGYDEKMARYNLKKNADQLRRIRLDTMSKKNMSGM